jgi:hypothetical protein
MGSCITKPVEVIAITEFREVLVPIIVKELREVIIPKIITELQIIDDNPSLVADLKCDDINK